MIFRRISENDFEEYTPINKDDPQTKTLKAIPFDSDEIITFNENGIVVKTEYDRVAFSRDLANWLSTYFSNGILIKGGNVLGDQLKVSHKSGLVVSVQPGEVCINGRTGWNEQVSDLTLEMGGSQPRIDRVVAELNIPDDRGIYLKVIKGSPADSPTAPALVQTDDVYQIPLATVSINANMATVDTITDTRQDISNLLIGIKPPEGGGGGSADLVTIGQNLQELFGLQAETATVENALKNTSIFASYTAFCGNVNADMLDAAFGKGNEGSIMGIGRALAMYAWFKGDSKTTHPYTALQKCNTLAEIGASQAAINEILASLNLYLFINSTKYTTQKLPKMTFTAYDNGVEHPDIDLIATLVAPYGYAGASVTKGSTSINMTLPAYTYTTVTTTYEDVHGRVLINHSDGGFYGYVRALYDITCTSVDTSTGTSLGMRTYLKKGSKIENLQNLKTVTAKSNVEVTLSCYPQGGEIEFWAMPAFASGKSGAGTVTFKKLWLENK